MKKLFKYESPEIEITKFEVTRKIMNDNDIFDGDKDYWEGDPSIPDTTVEDLFV